MNVKAMQWLQLAAFLKERERQFGARVKGSPVSMQELPSKINDPEVSHFLEARIEQTAEKKGCRQLHIEAVYQAVLAHPHAEAEIVATLQNDKERIDALYAHAAEYTRTLEAQAQVEEDYRKTLSSSTGGRWWQVVLIVVLVVCFGVAGYVYMSYRSMGRFLDTPVGAEKGKVTLTIPKGASSDQVLDALQSSGVVGKKHSARFSMLFRYHKHWHRLFSSQLRRGNVRFRFGRYKIETNLTPLEIFEKLRKGPPRVSIRVTIPEGFNIWKIAARLQRKGICRRTDFLKFARSRRFAVRLLGWDTPSVEGYLYPDTYRFNKNTPADRVIRVMVRRFKQLYRNEFRQKANELKMSTHQVVTLASIIEKETGQPTERPQISKVFHNRMKRGWKLETDPTVIYGLMPNFNGNLTSRDLHNPHPYNTYKHRGLPPGPIASPGVAAIRAALYPRGRRCIIFFVARGDRTHVFSCTKREHECWVDVYQRKSKPKSACARFRRRRR